MMTTLFLIIGAYLCGSIPFGKIVGRYYGVDIQKRGSGNIGYANVLRVLGRKAALITLSGDILKGFIPCYLASVWLPAQASPSIFWVGLAAMLGHLFPLWLRFRGGKGVATGLGVMFVIQPVAALIGSLIYIMGCTVGYKSSTSSLLGVVTVFIIAVASSPVAWWQYSLLLILITWKLRHNIRGTVPNYG